MEKTKRQQWDEENMICAMLAVKNAVHSEREAANV
jgi:hypothetical protein